MKKSSAHSWRRDTFYVYAGYVLRYLSLLVLIPYYGRTLGPTGYGKVLSAMAMMNIVWLVVNYGFSTAGVRELATATDPEERARIFGRHLSARLAMVPVGLAVGAAGTALSPILRADIGYGVLATLLGVFNAFNLGWFFQGIRRFRTSIGLEAISYLLTLVTALSLVRTAEDGLNALIALMSTSLICTALAYWQASRHTDIARPAGLSDAMREIRGAGALFINAVATTVITSGSTYFLGIISTIEQVGYFGAAERFATVGISLLNPLAQVLVPNVARLHVEDRRAAFDIVRKGMALEVAYGLVVLVGGTLVAPLVLPLILGHDFERSVGIFQILCCMFPFAALSHALSLYAFIPLRKEVFTVISIAAGAAVSLLTAALLARQWGGLGMAVARVAGEAVGALVLICAAAKLGLIRDIFRPLGHQDENLPRREISPGYSASED